MPIQGDNYVAPEWKNGQSHAIFNKTVNVSVTSGDGKNDYAIFKWTT